MWNSYGLELGWVGIAVLAFGLVLFLVDAVGRLRADLLGADGSTPSEPDVLAELDLDGEV
jgi:hypothetical protein